MAWPRSLLARNALLIAGLVIGGQIVSIACYIILVQIPRAERLADLTGRYIAVFEASFATLPIERLDEIASSFGRDLLRIDRRRSPPTESGPGSAVQLAITRRFLARLGALVGGREVQLVRDPTLKLWVEMHLGGERVWFVTEADELVAEHVKNWLIFSGFGVLIGLGGALLIQRRINRPLVRLAQAARQVGAGVPGVRLDEDGPTELGALARTFNRMIDDLAKVEQSRALMLAGISHDVRTPLTRIRLASEILAGQAEPELIARINSNLDRVNRIMEQFLSFARDESSEKPEYRDLDALIAERCRDHLADGRRIDLVRSELPHILVRPLALGRAIDNLLSNAFAHGAPPVTVSATSDATGVTIEIADRGAGLPAGDIAALRQPFERRGADGSGSAGLGLAIADRIIRLHGGTLDITNRPGGGLICAIRLPLG